VKKIYLDADCTDLDAGRIGGGAFIGNIIDWPKTIEGEYLTLIASIPIEMLVPLLGNVKTGQYVSVFSYYSKNDYFLDRITYHGNTEELNYIIKNNTTKVLIHKKGEIIQKGCSIKPMFIKLGEEDVVFSQGSGFGGSPGFLQNENILFNDKRFILQLYSDDFPEPHEDIFWLSDAVGYLYVNNDQDGGLFFTQVT
jgi:uncharacterized protein YwqG